MKLISFIIPVYGLNKGKNYVYFEKLLQMVSKASKILNGAFELIIVNDDKAGISKESIKDSCSKYGLLECLIYHENDVNNGQAYSRNVGASLASGVYLHFIDQDDYISDNFYESFMNRQEKVDFYISLPYFDKEGSKEKAYTVCLKSAYRNAKYISDVWYLLLSNLVYSPGQIIMSKQAFNSVNGFPDLKNRGADDFALFYKLVFSKKKYRVTLMDESKFCYRIHSQQNSKLSSTNISACEFLRTQNPQGIKQKIVFYQKTNKMVDWFGKLFYIIYFKRA